MPSEEDVPSIGGIVICKDKDNYLYVVRGETGRDDIALMGWLDKDYALIGRGRLVSERVILRLEMIDGRVKALCSTDGEQWYTVGGTDLAVKYPVEVGLCAFGLHRNNRVIYHGAYPEGTAIRFESFELWGK